MPDPLLLLVGIVLATILGANAIAYIHARALTRFAAAGLRTKQPEDLNLIEAARALLLGANIPRPHNDSAPGDVGLSSEIRSIPTRRGPTLEAWYVGSEHERPLVVLFHGYAASKSQLLPAARALHDLGYGALLVDFHGSGGSSGTGTSLGYIEAADVAATMTYAMRAWPERKIVLHGFSMGGAAILRAIAVEGVRPDAVVIEATFDTLLNTVRNRFHTMRLPATPFAHLLLAWGGLQWGFNPFRLNPVDYARCVRCPTLILHGDGDARVPAPQAQRLASALGANARMHVYAGVAHTPIAAARPSEWARDVGAFLARL